MCLTRLPFTHQRRMFSFEKEIFSAAFKVEFNDEVMQSEIIIMFSKVQCPFKNTTSTSEKRTLHQACNVVFNDDVVC